MLGEDSRPKSLEHSLDEKRRLEKLHHGILRAWEKNKITYALPEDLNESFVVVDWGRPGYTYSDEPRCFFCFLSSFGSFRINMWIINRQQKVIIVSNDLYTLGNDGNTRGKGKQGLESLHKVLQNISDSTGFYIYDIAIPNTQSANLLEGHGEYQELSDEQFSMLSNVPKIHDNVRWKRLTEPTSIYDTKIKLYTPNSIVPSLSWQEKRDLDTILEVTNFDRLHT